MQKKDGDLWVCRGTKRHVTESGQVALGNLQPVEAAVLPESTVRPEAKDPAVSALPPLRAAPGEGGSQCLGRCCLLWKPPATCGE